jgi:branched-subunit amino acid ABC-type transport system permease component
MTTTLMPAVPDAVTGSVTVAGFTYPMYRLVFIAACMPVASGLWWLVDRSRVGLLVRAAATDPQMVQTLGISPQLLLAGTLSIGSAAAVTAGGFAAPIIASAPGVDEHLLVIALTVVVLGGVTSICGIFTASLALGQVDTLGVALWPQAAAFVVLGFLIAVLTWRSRHTREQALP